MATTDEIDLALECDGCNAVLDAHLEECEPLECAVVTAWELNPLGPRAAAMVAMMTAAAGAHECHDHRMVHDRELHEDHLVDLDDTRSL